MNPLRKALIGGALAATTLAGGAVGAALATGTAGAQDTSTTPSTESAATVTLPPQGQAPQGQTPQGQNPQGQAPQQGDRQAPPSGSFDPSKGGHQANGKTEELLTGDAKAKVEAAAKDAVDGGTVQRVETDAEGAAYEAHVQKSDGSLVTVKLDSSYKVTSVEEGPA